LLYHFKISFFEKYKVIDEPWPWESDKEGWRSLVVKSLLLTLANQFIITPILLLWDVYNGCDFRTDKESLPCFTEMIWQIALFMIGEDFLFYWAHRFLHVPWVYPYVHKIHHTYTHTVSIATEYAHPIEWICGNVIPSNFVAILLGKRVHLFTYLMWIVMIITESIDAHSGYEFSFSPYRILPFSGSSDFHYYHHVAVSGNYGSWFTFWDRMCGTVSNAFMKYRHNKADKADKLE
jgi:methylsterol monooxygenase/4-alpha-methyl-delta7-sterol-4alpha-methyl oxidase